MVAHLGDEFDFRIVTSDRDSFEEISFHGIAVDAWNRVGKALVYYASPGNRTFVHYLRLMRETPHDVLYLNSYFNSVFTLLPLLARRINHSRLAKPVILAPRGEFSLGAFALRFYKKSVYCYLIRIVGLCKDIVWQASSEYEAADIRRVTGCSADRIVIAPNMPPLQETPPESAIETSVRAKKHSGPLRVVFLSRISPKKNLSFALRVLTRMSEPIEFNIYGLVDDEDYWRGCREIIERSMPTCVRVCYRGVIQHDLVSSVLAQHDIFFLPTLGENYGHVIYESLAVGVPVLISDTTPWQDLGTERVGWVVSLDTPEIFVDILETQAHLPETERKAQRLRALSYARRLTERSETLKTNRALFEKAANGNWLQ